MIHVRDRVFLTSNAVEVHWSDLKTSSIFQLVIRASSFWLSHLLNQLQSLHNKYCKEKLVTIWSSEWGTHFRPNFGLHSKNWNHFSQNSDLSGMKQDILHFYFQLQCFYFYFFWGIFKNWFILFIKKVDLLYVFTV